MFQSGSTKVSLLLYNFIIYFTSLFQIAFKLNQTDLTVFALTNVLDHALASSNLRIYGSIHIGKHCWLICGDHDWHGRNIDFSIVPLFHCCTVNMGAN